MPIAPRRWSLPGPKARYVIAWSGDAMPRRGWSPIPGVFAGSALEGWIASHPSVLYDLYSALGGARRAGLSRSALREHHREIVNRVAEALRSGVLVAYREKPLVMSREVASEAPPEPALVEPVAEEPENYVSIRLVGEDGKGIPGERYRVVLPDSSVREGRLDGSGTATLRGRFSGTCKVTFPNLDAAAWEAA